MAEQYHLYRLAMSLLEGDKENIAYGMGNMGKMFIPEAMRHAAIGMVWDAFSEEKSFRDVPIGRPMPIKEGEQKRIIIFVDDGKARSDIRKNLFEMGYRDIWYFRDFLSAAEEMEKRLAVVRVDEATEEMLSPLVENYGSICSDLEEVYYSLLPKAYRNLAMPDFEYDERQMQSRLRSVLVNADKKPPDCGSVVADFIQQPANNLYEFAEALEVFLRMLLCGGVKTAERPIRMEGDRPYDPFAVCKATGIIFGEMFPQADMALSVLRKLCELSNGSIPLRSVECRLLMRMGRHEEALLLARKAMNGQPNDFLANENFYQVAVQCRDNGISVREALPDYDLSERFCWCGLTYALCYGFDGAGEAQFCPCFRTFQCAARPEGDFSDSDEWREFRRSVTDGSFRYCHKNQCSNIIGRWLPKKSECDDETIRMLLAGDESVKPQLKELHFSYDAHCNLTCPSCRSEFRTADAAEKQRLDGLYEKNLKPLLRRAEHLCLSGCGEAILSPHSREILRSLTPMDYPGLVVELRTNASALNRKTWLELGEGRKAIRHIAASIDGATKETFERLRYPAKWETVNDNLAFIRELRRKGEIDLFEFAVVVQKDNLEELIDLIHMAMRYDADVVTMSHMINWGGMSGEDYIAADPYRADSPYYGRMQEVMSEIDSLRQRIEAATDTDKKIFINLHCLPDVEPRYSMQRLGRLKVR